MISKEYVIQNLVNRYSEYGIPRELIEKVISKVEGTVPYDTIHICLRTMLSSNYDTDECFSVNDLIKAYGNMSVVSKKLGISIKNIQRANPDEPIFRLVKGKKNILTNIKNSQRFKQRIEER